MKLLKSHPLFSLLNSYLIDSPQPVNISYLWNFGSLLGVCLVIQIITCKSTTDLSHLLSTLDNLDLRESLSAPEDKGPCHHNLSLTGPLFLLNNKWCNLIKKVFSGSREYLNSFQFIKGLNHGLTLPTLPLKVEKYHKSFLRVGKIIRVSGGISAYILLTSSSEFSLFDKESLEPFFYLIASLGLYHLIYMSTIFSLRFLYVMYHIISGNWIHRNSPLK